MPKLRVIEGPHAGEVFELTGHRVLAGRDLNNAIYLPDGLVSRHHAEFVQKGNRIVVRDLDSTNGTFLNDQPVTEAELKDGDVVRLADVVMRFEADTVAPTPPNPSWTPSRETKPAPSPAQLMATPPPPPGAKLATGSVTSTPPIPKLRRDPLPTPQPTSSQPPAPAPTAGETAPRLYTPTPKSAQPSEPEIVIVEAPPRKIAPFLITGAVGVLVLIAGYTLDANALRFWGLVLLMVGLLCTVRDWTPLPPKPREP